MYLSVLLRVWVCRYILHILFVTALTAVATVAGSYNISIGVTLAKLFNQRQHNNAWQPVNWYCSNIVS